MTVYLDPSKPPADNIDSMLQGATRTKRGAELAGKITRFPPKEEVIKPCAALIIGGIVTGIIFALVMSNPVFLLVGLGFSAIGGGMMIYKRVEYLKLIRDSQDEEQKTQTIYHGIANNANLDSKVDALKKSNPEHPFIRFEARLFDIRRGQTRYDDQGDEKPFDTYKWGQGVLDELSDSREGG